jgi:hypothetical protein
MTIEQAFKKLLSEWEDLPKEYRDKYRSYRSKHLKGEEPIGVGKMREMLLKAGYKENWT